MRRTPSLTKQCRDYFEQEFMTEGWQPGGTLVRIAAATGLTVPQVRDAILGESADAWRRDFAARVGGTLSAR